MAVNPTVILTFILLFLMMGAGLFSGTWGYSLGREALRGITQPDSRPGSPIRRSERKDPPSEQGMTFLDETKLIEDVKARMSGKPSTPESTPAPGSVAPTSSRVVEETPPESELASDSPSSGVSDANFEPGTAESSSETAVDAGMESATWESPEVEAPNTDGQPDETAPDSPASDPFAESDPFLDTESN